MPHYILVLLTPPTRLYCHFFLHLKHWHYPHVLVLSVTFIFFVLSIPHKCRCWQCLPHVGTVNTFRTMALSVTTLLILPVREWGETRAKANPYGEFTCVFSDPPCKLPHSAMTSRTRDPAARSKYNVNCITWLLQGPDVVQHIEDVTRCHLDLHKDVSDLCDEAQWNIQTTGSSNAPLWAPQKSFAKRH